ncbi:unnamed protein product [Moneuplotes crassus]|uniref:Uncharacterized protein n=2 Tax=Euplotes crassus TaxID=5936 RepID=A0AAD1UEK6_EUPCR|nr:unnamed protein product [Moneuplotes crassus]
MDPKNDVSEDDDAIEVTDSGNLSKRLSKEREQLEIAEKAVAIRQKTRELEWFEMESKVRNLVYELLQPTSKKLTNNKHESEEIRKDMKVQDDRIEKLEYTLKITSKKGNSTVFDDINDKILKNEKARIEQNDVISSNIKSIEDEQINMQDNCKDLRNILKRIEDKFDEMYKELKYLSSIQIKDKEELNKKFVDVSKQMVEELQTTRKNVSILDNKVDILDSNTKFTTSKLEECNNYIEILENKHLTNIRDKITELDKFKVNKSDLNNDILESRINDLSRLADIYANKIKFIENFIDKYQPIQIQSQISDSIYSFVNPEMRKSYKIHLSIQMEKFHRRVLEDEGTTNLELSCELLANLASDSVRKLGNKKSKYGKIKSHSQHNQDYSKAPNMSHNLSVPSGSKQMVSLEHEVIMEKSEVESVGESSAIRSSPGDSSKAIADSSKAIGASNASISLQAPQNSSLDIRNPKLSGKAFIKAGDQYQIEEFKRENSGNPSLSSTPNMPFIHDMQEVEDVLFDLQNNYVNLEAKLDSHYLAFTQGVETKVNELAKAVEFSNNQMNVYMQMLGQQMENKDK